MMKIQKNSLFLLSLFLFLPAISNAAVPAWQIVPKDSSLTFTGTQNDAPVTGEFKKFTGEINFAPDQLNASNVKITIDVSSIADPYNQLADTLKGADWFDAKTYPQAIFKADHFTKTGDKTYEADGMLTIRDKTQPEKLMFTLEEYTQNKARIKGSTTIKRIAFGIGQGEWADTKSVKDDVRMEFTISAVKK